MTEPAIDTIAHAIQLAVAPVFLLAGVGAILSVMSGRLARIVDRSRVLHEREVQGDQCDVAARNAERVVLHQRMVVANVGICLCTLCALLICTVVAILFLGSVTSNAVAIPIAWCFVGAMACLVCALLALLVEIYLATLKMAIRR